MHANGGKTTSGLAALGFAALGVVFGDIGTSPLYTLKTVLELSRDPGPLQVFGVLSLIIWTLLAITSLKYVTVAMRVDNDGEGGILALMALLGVKRQQRPAIVALGLAGAALIYGDGAITPAISVLSALEGLTITEPALAALCAADRGRDPDRPVRDPVAGNGAHRPRLRPGDGDYGSSSSRCSGLPGSPSIRRSCWHSIRAMPWPIRP